MNSIKFAGNFWVCSMRKFFIFMSALMLIATACAKYDDSEILSRLKEHEDRIARLETLCEQINTNISSMQVIISALEGKDYVTAVIPIKSGDEVVGYTIKFEKSGDITIYNGKDGSSPVLAVKEDSDGILYWTVNGEWLTDATGAKVKASAEDGITPMFKIEEGRWMISTDGGATWSDAGQATGDSMFKEVVIGEDNVDFVLADGTTFSIPKNTTDFFTIPYGIIMLSEKFDDVLKGDTLYVDFIVNPSNFKLNPDELSLLVKNDIYTKFDIYEKEVDGEMKSVETPFDTTAHCDFSILDAVQSEEYPGAYRAVIAVGGEGNFFDDADLYLLYGNKDSKGEERYICANDDFRINVIPSLGEAFTLATGHQSFRTFDYENKTEGPVKKYIAGLWANRYKNIGDATRTYDRTKVQSLSSSNSDFKFDSQYFMDYSLLTFDPDLDSEFWKAYTDPEEGAEVPDYAEFEDSINLVRGRESASYAFTGRMYFSVVMRDAEDIVESTLREYIASKTRLTFDLMPAYKKSGAYDADLSSYRSMSNNISTAVYERSNLALFKINKENMTIDGRFTSYPGCNPAGLVFSYTAALNSTQDKDGQMVPFWPEDLDLDLINCLYFHDINIIEGE